VTSAAPAGNRGDGTDGAPGRRRRSPGAKKIENLCFVIGRPRSGTTVFKGMLQTHPQVWSFGEVLNESNPRSYFHFLRRLQAEDRDSISPSKSISNFMEYLGWCRKTALERQPTNRVIVLDFKYDQAHLLCEPWWSLNSLPRIFSLIRELGCKVIDVHRTDLVRLVISNKVAIETKIYHSNKLEPGTGHQAKIHIDPDRLLHEIGATAKAYDKVVRHFRSYPGYLQICYEDMFEEGEFSPSLVRRVASFLGVPDEFDRKPQLSKLLGDDVFSYIDNADEVRERLARQDKPGRRN
jgi:hypothetical protein